MDFVLVLFAYVHFFFVLCMCVQHDCICSMSSLILHMQMSEWENLTSRICHLRPCVKSYAILTQKYQRSRHWFIRIPHNRSIRAEDCGTWSCLPSVFTPRPAALIYWPWETLAMQTLVSTPTHKHTQRHVHAHTRSKISLVFVHSQTTETWEHRDSALCACAHLAFICLTYLPSLWNTL